ncbi:cyclodeaminase/cyclohydrolase family protein [Streptomyces sp. TS71-3]|uniref:cyclodeaminase/cyclohydrolase family protein n=1 Tax=Streptomyces sp. TS71-3 TaxID=2733862 RepID=UPI001B1D9DEF|nr:cyclodeaminase/cyclohydrolase family protein [Streptomyces sp. TS71-3]GHJ40189.1 formiminotransferase-cyclodeaminase [Streptomyces sp. TS71-3]
MRNDQSPPAERPLRDETIDGFLGRLAARVPAPGGGAVAGLHAAQAAALLGMVARYSTGEKYAAHAALVSRVTAACDDLCTTAVTLAEDDARAFTAVTDAYRLPRGTDEEKAARSAAIARALAAAATPPREVICTALRTVELAEELLPAANRNVISDVAAAAEAARAAATTARINVEINLTGIKDPLVRAELTEAVHRVDVITARADQITAAVRKEIAS